MADSTACVMRVEASTMAVPETDLRRALFQIGFAFELPFESFKWDRESAREFANTGSVFAEVIATSRMIRAVMPAVVPGIDKPDATA